MRLRCIVARLSRMRKAVAPEPPVGLQHRWLLTDQAARRYLEAPKIPLNQTLLMRPPTPAHLETPPDRRTPPQEESSSES